MLEHSHNTYVSCPKNGKTLLKSKDKDLLKLNFCVKSSFCEHISIKNAFYRNLLRIA
ncbi:hypothetical protein LEP1GSC168_3848 [Leptospira santarosai str. HAI134]|nr:hypothetical protein LEP1GSC169_2279 [Leptospira santarosai str. HAI1349]EMO20575.1 hypothetical protein LEP1GSC168_3848 [Leptospira santarosai str. HAI134]EMP80677.1 hypothetical protein LEP1GSC162_3711 [Leptospira santarosai str. CBC1531]